MAKNLRLVVFQFLLLCLFVSQSAGAEPPSPAAPCTMCGLPLPAEVARAPKADVCDDLGYAACTSPEGDGRYKKLINAVNQQIRGIIEEASDRAARPFGAPSAQVFLLRELEKSGLRLRKDMSPEAKASLVGQGPVAPGADFGYSAATAECQARVKELNKFQLYDPSMSPEAFREQITKTEEVLRLNRQTHIEIATLDITGFLQFFAGKCQQLASIQTQSAANLPLASYPAVQELARACQDTNAIRQRVLRIYRAQKNLTASPELREIVESLIDGATFDLSKLAPAPVYGGRAGSANAYGPVVPAAPTVVDKLRARYMELQRSPYFSCPEPSANSVSQVKKSALDKLIRSRVFVETMIDKLYPSDRRAQFEGLFNDVKNEVRKVAARVVKDPAKLAQINARYDQLKLSWLSKPAADIYVRDPSSGVPLLPLDIELRDAKLERAFGRGNLSFFSVLNAFYVPETKQGVLEAPSTVTLMPMFFLLAQRNTFTLIGTLAHEAGHQIGPVLSAVNGFDLRPNYRPLLQCMARSDSFALQENQSDEAIADYISAEVTATMIGQLPPQKQRAAALATVGDYCYFNAQSMGSMEITVDEVHPESLLRISGIFGANTGFRKVLGCAQASPSFHTCDLDHTK